MHEKIFQREVIKSFRNVGGWIYKIPDSSKFQNSRFIPEKPCDLIGIINKQIFAIECKQYKKWRGFGIQDLRPSQLKGLREVQEAGGESWVFINFRIPKECNKLIPISFSSLQSLRSSINNLREGFSIDCKNGIFDLSTFFGMYYSGLL